MSKTIEELEAEFEELDKVVAQMKADIMARLKKLKEEQEPKAWQPKPGRFHVTANGTVCSTKTSELAKTFGTERETAQEAEIAARRMRFFNRTLAWLEEHGWDSTLKVSENPAGDVVITFMNSADISYPFLKETREGRLDL